MSDGQTTDFAPESYEWGVQWEDGVITYASEEIARYEWQYPTRPDHVNPRIVRRQVGPWVPVYQSYPPEQSR